MPIEIKYTGTQQRWPELAITGKQSVWMPGQIEERDDTEAGKLLATGLFKSEPQPLYITTSAQGVGIVRRTNIYDARVLGLVSSAAVDNLTAHICVPCPYPFTHVQIELGGVTASAGINATIAASSAKGNGYSPVDSVGAAVTPTAVTWGTTDIYDTDNPGGGVTTAALATSTPAANFVVSDIIPLQSVSRTDSGSNYLAMLRVYSSGKSPIAVANGMGAAGLTNNGRIQEYEPDWGCGYKVGDFVTANYTSYNASNGDNFAPSAAIRFFTAADIVSIASYGDSTMTGFANQSGCGGGAMMGYVRVATRALASEGVPATHINGAYQSQTSGYFLVNAMREIRLLRPSIAVLRAWSINDGYTDADFYAAFGRLTRAIAVCRSVGTVPVIEVPPPQNLTGADAINLIAYQNKIRNYGGVLFDLDALTTDGNVNPKIRPELLNNPGTDNIHFGRAGHDYLGAALAALLRKLVWKFA